MNFPNFEEKYWKKMVVSRQGGSDRVESGEERWRQSRADEMERIGEDVEQARVVENSERMRVPEFVLLL